MKMGTPFVVTGGHGSLAVSRLPNQTSSLILLSTKGFGTPVQYLVAPPNRFCLSLAFETIIGLSSPPTLPFPHLLPASLLILPITEANNHIPTVLPHNRPGDHPTNNYSYDQLGAIWAKMLRHKAKNKNSVLKQTQLCSHSSKTVFKSSCKIICKRFQILL